MMYYPEEGGIYELQAQLQNMATQLALFAVNNFAEQDVVLEANRKEIARLNALDAQAYRDAHRARRCHKLLLGLFAGRPLNRETPASGLLEPELSHLGVALELADDDLRSAGASGRDGFIRFGDAGWRAVEVGPITTANRGRHPCILPPDSGT